MSSATIPLRSTAGERAEAMIRAAVLVGLPLVVAIVALVLALQARMPPIPSDQLNYFDLGRDLPEVPDRPNVYHQFQRIGLVAPLAVAIRLVGYTPAAYYAVPILASVALSLGVYAIGSLLFSRVVGVAAAILVIANSAIFIDLATPLPDVLSAALFCWAMVLTIAIRQERAWITGTTTRRTVGLVGIGLLLGWSYLTREFIVLLWPLVPILLFRPVGLRGLLWVAAPLVAIGIGELALNAAMYDDPLARVRSVLGHGEGPMSTAQLSAYRDQDRLWYANRLPEALREFAEGGWLTAFLIVTTAGAVFWPSHRLLLAWVAFLVVPLSLLGGVLDPAHPMLRLTNFRYWFPIVPALVLGGVGGTWMAVRWLLGSVPTATVIRDVVAGALAVTVALVPMSMASDARADDARYIGGGAVQLETLQSWLQTDGAGIDRLWTDARTSRILPMFAAGAGGRADWEGEVRPMGAVDDPQPGDHVLLYSADRGICSRCRDALSRVLGIPVSVPESWSPVFETDDGVVRVYEVGAPG